MKLCTKNGVKFLGKRIQEIGSEQDSQTHFSSCDLDLDPVTLIKQHDLDSLTVYLHTKNEVSRSGLLNRHNNTKYR